MVVKFVVVQIVVPLQTGVQGIGMQQVQVHKPMVNMTLGAHLDWRHSHAKPTHSAGIVMQVDTKTKMTSPQSARFVLLACTKMNTDKQVANRVQVEAAPSWNLRGCGNVHAPTLMPQP